MNMRTKQEKRELRKIFCKKLKQATWDNFRHELEQKSIDPSDNYGIQTFIGEKIGMSQQAVNHWFNEEEETLPRIEQLPKISKGLNVSIDYLLKNEREDKVKDITKPPVDLTHLIATVAEGVETEDFVSFPIQTLNSNIQPIGQSPGQVIIHKRVFGRRKSLAAIQLNRGKETEVVIIGK